MSFPQGVFSVLFFYENRIGIFTSRKAADKYWRRVQETRYRDNPGSNEPQLRFCSRKINISAYYWNQKLTQEDWASGIIPSLFTIDSCGHLAHDQMPSDLRPDNINGERYYIRSAIQPNLFWFYDSGIKQITTSSGCRTKFTIRRKNSLPYPCRPEEDILIDEDDIHIFVTTPEWEGDSADVMIVKGARKVLVAASVLSLNGQTAADVVNAGTFKFGMFDRGFGVLDANSWDGKEVFANARTDGGERWEFIQ